MLCVLACIATMVLLVIAGATASYAHSGHVTRYNVTIQPGPVVMTVSAEKQMSSTLMLETAPEMAVFTEFARASVPVDPVTLYHGFGCACPGCSVTQCGAGWGMVLSEAPVPDRAALTDGRVWPVRQAAAGIEAVPPLKPPRFLV